jgi:hypothetical protein
MYLCFWKSISLYDSYFHFTSLITIFTDYIYYVLYIYFNFLSISLYDSYFHFTSLITTIFTTYYIYYVVGTRRGRNPEGPRKK